MSMQIICPDCGKQELFRSSVCPKCGGASWFPAGSFGTIVMRQQKARLRALAPIADVVPLKKRRRA